MPFVATPHPAMTPGFRRIVARCTGRVVGAGLRPGLDALRRRDGRAVRRDAVAGVTVAAYLVPQVLAYSAVAGLPAVTGLWAAIGALVLYALLGSSRWLSAGPESTTAVMTAVAVGPLAAGDPARYAVLAAALACLVGVICLLARLARLGFVAEMLSRPVLVGYLAGIALIMIAGQLGPVSGVPVTGETPVTEAVSFVQQLDAVHVPTLLMAAGVLALLVVGGAALPKLPMPLIAVSFAAAVAALFALERFGIGTVGGVPQGLPVPAIPAIDVADLTALVVPAAGVAFVAFCDDVLTARAFGDRGRDQIDADRELVAIGAANVAAGLLHGFPVSSSGSRTVIGESAGGRSQLSSVVSAAAVVVVLLVAGSLLAALPQAALGALVVYAACRLVRVREFRRFARFRRAELAIALLATVAVVLFGVLYGVLVAVLLSVLDLVRRVSRPHDGILGFVPGLAGMHDIDDHPGATTVPGLVVYRYDAPLCFANAEDFRRRVEDAVVVDPPPRWLLLNAEAVTEIDLTAADVLRDLIRRLTARGIVVAVARAKTELWRDLQRAGVTEVIDERRVFPTLPTAVAAYREAEEDQPGTRSV